MKSRSGFSQDELTIQPSESLEMALATKLLSFGAEAYRNKTRYKRWVMYFGKLMYKYHYIQTSRTHEWSLFVSFERSECALRDNLQKAKERKKKLHFSNEKRGNEERRLPKTVQGWDDNQCNCVLRWKKTFTIILSWWIFIIGIIVNWDNCQQSHMNDLKGGLNDVQSYISFLIHIELSKSVTTAGGLICMLYPLWKRS